MSSDLRKVLLCLGHLRGLDHRLVQVLRAPDRHGLDCLPGAVLTLAVDRRLIQEHFPVAALLGHIRGESHEVVGVGRAVHVLVHAD